jgi:hypothetical protein
MTAQWRQRLTTMVDGVRSDQHIRLNKAELSAPAAADQIAAAQRAAGTALPEQMLSFYREVNGFVLEWEGPGDIAPDATVRGTINLLPIGRVFGDWQNVTFGQPVKPFDLFVPEACAALWWPQGATDSTVRFHYFGEATVDTRHSFTEYLERLLVSRGFWYWIQALSRETSDNPEAEAFRTVAPRLFPDFQESLFQLR